MRLGGTSSAILPILTFLVSVGLCAATLTHPLHGMANERKSHFDDALYLPNGEALHLISFGFRNALARVLWFNTINYFGKEYATSRNYRWLYHMCDLVTTLDPRALHVFKFGAVMLAWEANEPKLSIALLNKVIELRPRDWHFFYLRGFTSMFFLKDNEAARKDFIAGARLPDAPPIMARLAARVASDEQNDREAEELLRDLIKNTSDPVAREALASRLKELTEKRR